MCQAARTWTVLLALCVMSDHHLWSACLAPRSLQTSSVWVSLCWQVEPIASSPSCWKIKDRAGITNFSEVNKVHMTHVVNLHFVFLDFQMQLLFSLLSSFAFCELVSSDQYQSSWAACRLPDFHYHTFSYLPLLWKACHSTNCSSSEIMCPTEMEALLPLVAPRKWPKHLQMLMGFKKGKSNVVSARRLFN